MPEITALRLLLAVAELSVAVLVVRRDAGRLWGWAAYCYWAGAVDLIPFLPADPQWKTWLWMPVQTALFLLLANAVRDAYGFLAPTVSRSERTSMAGLGAGIGFCFAAVPAHQMPWNPENLLQQFCLTRQYVILALAVGHTAAWAYISGVRAVCAERLVKRHGTLLVGYLWLYFVASTAGKGGLLWNWFEWRGGDTVWRVHNAACLLVGAGLMAGWVWMLR